jgi:DNA-directed RNA polymerase
MELMRLHGTGGISEGMKTTRAVVAVGKAVELEHKAEALKKHTKVVPTMAPRTTSYFTKKAYRELRQWREDVQRHMEGSGEWTADWTQSTRARVGGFLIDALMESAKVMRTVRTRDGEEM